MGEIVLNYEKICVANPTISLRRMIDDEFHNYGRLCALDDVQTVMQLASEAAQTIKSGNGYLPEVPALTNLASLQSLGSEVYGGLPIQVGVCVGTNTVLNGVEFHQGSETLVAIEDCVLILGRQQDMRNDCYDTRNVVYFYMEKGQVTELFSTTLHYTPCRVGKTFCTAVMLLKGSNTPIEFPHGLLTKKNKWFITHKTVTEKIAQGAFPGLLGDIPSVVPLA